MIRFTCEHCGTTLEAEDLAKGETIECPKCARVVVVPESALAAAKIGASSRRTFRIQTSAESHPPAAGRVPAVQRVVIEDVDVPFASMLLLAWKWMCASLLALLPFALVGVLIGIAAGSCSSSLVSR